jgi:hypothetical protein
VIDASGTYATPNPLGASGLPAEGERALAERIHYGIPDVLGPRPGALRGRRTLVVGSGHSAFNAVLDLAALARGSPGTRWSGRCGGTRSGRCSAAARDALPGAASLGRAPAAAGGEGGCAW